MLSGFSRLSGLCAVSLLLAGCVGSGASSGAGGKTSTVKSAPRSAASPSATAPIPGVVARPPAPPRPAPRILSVPGLEGVIGADADALIRQFGPARLDVREDDARKLQWSGTACILDVYLYPTSPGARPVATHLEARRGDGRDVDRVACTNALRRKP